MPVVDDGTQEVVALLGDPVLDPDTGVIQGFFVTGTFPRGMLFLQVVDIVGWGMQVHIRSADRLAPPEEIIRLRRLFEERRTILGQPIRTRQSNNVLGTCGDVQFNTHHFTLEWLFPRRFFLYRQPVPANEIVEVTDEAVWVNDPLRPSRVRPPSRENTLKEDGSVTEAMPTA
jgi:uncharacterized protein YrrD